MLLEAAFVSCYHPVRPSLRQRLRRRLERWGFVKPIPMPPLYAPVIAPCGHTVMINENIEWDSISSIVSASGAFWAAMTQDDERAAITRLGPGAFDLIGSLPSVDEIIKDIRESRDA
jgi:hypothetical protein